MTSGFAGRTSRRLVLATRGSPLARWQAQRVADLLAGVPAAPPVVLRTVHTIGDRLPAAPLAELGGQGVFVKEVQAAVLSGQADLAVHSAKDLPARTPSGLVLAAVPERADPRDALAGARLGDLPAGATVATSSPRRRAQLAWLRPDLTFAEVRGNIARRLDHHGATCVVVAAAALSRLDLADRAAEVLDPSLVLPQVGQGALAVECRADDEVTRALLAAVDDAGAHRAVLAERSFLAAVGGGCRAAVGALAGPAPGAGPGAALMLHAMLAGGDGHIVLRRRVTGTDPEALGLAAFAALRDECGAATVGAVLAGTAVGGR